MYSLAFRRYVKRVERQALAGRLDAIRTLGALAIALATLTVPGHADSMLGAPAVRPPPLAIVTAPASEQWTIQALLGVNGTFIHSTRVGDATFTTGEKCQTAVLADAQLRTTLVIAGKAAVRRYGKSAHVLAVCSMAVE